MFRRLALTDHRLNAKAYWPELAGRELFAAGAMFALLRFHTPALGLVWANAHRARRWRSPRVAPRHLGKLLHVTSSFDLGGTQKQIRNLCASETARFVHETTEVFPELNYLFRRGETIDPGRYLAGGLLGRTAGRFITNVGTRSPQLIQAYKLARDMEAARPDVVVGWGHEMCVTAFVAATIARVPHIVFCIRTLNPAYGWTTESLGQLLGVAHRRMSAHVSAVITNSTVARDDHARWAGLAPASIHVCPNGIDVASLTEDGIARRRALVRRQLDIRDETCVATNVGRFSFEKGQMSIVAVNERLMRDFPPDSLTWLLCGDGPTLESVRSRAQNLGMTNIRFLGRTSLVQDYLCASDLFVMPSDFEGMPNAMMEAMAFGLPCVSTNRSGALDVARDGEEALYYEPGNLDQMERQIRRLLNDRDGARAMGARAQARLRAFSVTQFVETFERTIERTLATRA